jgi:hypothetical protein
MKRTNGAGDSRDDNALEVPCDNPIEHINPHSVRVSGIFVDAYEAESMTHGTKLDVFDFLIRFCLIAESSFGRRVPIHLRSETD